MDTEKQRQRRHDDARLTESRNARSEQLLMELLTNRGWLPGELLSGLEHRRPSWFLDMRFQTCLLCNFLPLVDYIHLKKHIPGSPHFSVLQATKSLAGGLGKRLTFTHGGLGMRLTFTHGGLGMRLTFTHGGLGMRLTFTHGGLGMRLTFTHGGLGKRLTFTHRGLGMKPTFTHGGLGMRLSFTHPFTVVQVVWYELDVRVGRINM